MRHFLLIIAMITSACPAMAGPRENALNHLSQVLAIASMCPDLEMQTVTMGLIAMKYKIDLKADQAKLIEQAADQARPWKGKEKDACVAGLMLYGPSGLNVPNLLAEK